MKMLMIASLLCAAANMVSAEDGITVRPSGVGGRIWQVSYAPNEPVKWPWVGESTSARLTVVSYSGRTKTTVHEIKREEGEYFGSYQLPTDEKEQLFDLEVSILAGEKELETLSARVAVLPKKINVLVEGSDAWKTVRGRSCRPCVSGERQDASVLPEAGDDCGNDASAQGYRGVVSELFA